MQSLKLTGLLVAAVMASSSAVAAPSVPRAEARLATPAAATVEKDVGGIHWTCTDANCVGVAIGRPGLDSVMKECRKVAAALGPLASYESRGRAFTPGNLGVCNKLAAKDAGADVAAAK